MHFYEVWIEEISHATRIDLGDLDTNHVLKNNLFFINFVTTFRNFYNFFDIYQNLCKILLKKGLIYWKIFISKLSPFSNSFLIKYWQIASYYWGLKKTRLTLRVIKNILLVVQKR